MNNSYGTNNSEATDHQYGVYDTLNGEWVGTWFDTREDAESWVKTQDDKYKETGDDWTDGETYTVISTKDDEDVIF